MEGSPHPAPSLEAQMAYGSPNEILDTLHRVRDSLATLIVTTGADPTKIRSTARLLGLDHNHIWPVAQIINSDDILSAAKNIPTTKRIDALCQACHRHGATEADVEAVREAMRNLECLIEISAGSRESFWDLLQGLTYDDVTKRQEESRKLIFRGQSSVWGVRAKVNFKTVISLPSARQADLIDVVRLGGLIDLTRLRPIPWSLFRMMTYKDDGAPAEANINALDSAIGDPTELPILKDFCSDPLPEIRSVETECGKCFDISPGLIGNLGSVDCVFGDVIQDFVSVYRQDEERYHAAMIDLQTPAETLLFDFFVHKDLDFPTPPEVVHLDRLNAARGYNTSADEWNKLPLSAKVAQLGPASASIATHHYPEYRRLLDYTFDRIEIPLEEFKGFRFLMTYPTVPSAIVLRVPLLPAPEQ